MAAARMLGMRAVVGDVVAVDMEEVVEGGVEAEEGAAVVGVVVVVVAEGGARRL